MPVLSFICAFFCLLYILLMALYLRGWVAKRSVVLPAAFEPRTRISVVIPARNEAANISGAVASVLGGSYPRHLLELIVVDDFSEDATAGLAAGAGAQVIRMEDLPLPQAGARAFKKQALSAGISASTGELIITMDGDCIAAPDWLRRMAFVYESGETAALIGPVAFHDGNRLVTLFQSLDFTTMQGITAAAHQLELGNMANGANFGFSRAAFEAVGGYRDISTLASGDDYLLLHKLKTKYPHGVRYVKSQAAIVRTEPQPDWRSFFRQRIRWASKSGKYPDHRLTAILGLVYLFNVALLLTAVAAALGAVSWRIPLSVVAIKTIAELLFLWPVAGFYGKRRELLWFPLLQPLHMLYIVSAGFLGMMGSYEWKGRKLR